MSASETPMFATGQKTGSAGPGASPTKTRTPQPKLGVDDPMETSKGPHHPSHKLLWNRP